MIGKKETGLVLVRDTKFDKIRRRILMLFWGKDYEILQNFENMFKVNRPTNVIIPKVIKGKRNRIFYSCNWIMYLLWLRA